MNKEITEDTNHDNILGRAKGKNLSSRFFPAKTNFSESRRLSWSIVAGLVVATLTGKSLKKGYDLDAFKEDCHAEFENLLDEPDAWKIIEEVYFSNNQLSYISPEFLVFRCNQTEENSDSKQVASFFSDLLGEKRLLFRNKNLNFIEKVFPRVLSSKMALNNETSKLTPYVPFMAELFRRDIEWLSLRPEYFQKHIQSFLSLYIFLYSAQLGLTIAGWESGEPIEAKPLYFILENEKASLERTHVIDNGFKSFRLGAEKTFAFLTMNELLQMNEKETLPLWAYFKKLNENDQPGRIEYLKDLTIAFAQDRKLEIDPEALSSIDGIAPAIRFLLQLSMKQFTSRKSSRSDVHLKYANYIEKILGKGFIDSRGRVGRILVLPSDVLILITNIVIGNRDKVRLHELMKDFKARGIFFDLQSEQALINFYSNMGNSVRLSDSGDAVYVCKTI